MTKPSVVLFRPSMTLGAVLAALFALNSAIAQDVQPGSTIIPSAGAYNSSAPTCTAGGICTLQTDINGQLKVSVSGGGSGGFSTTDEVAFIAGTSVFGGGGGFYQTTATDNALTNGQQGMWQLTANRAGFVNLRTSAGAEIAAATSTLQTTANTKLDSIITNTAAAIPAGTALIGKVGIDQTTPGTTNGVAIVGVNGATALAGNGVTGTGSPRVTLASDGTAISTVGFLSAKIDQTTPGTTNGVQVNAALPVGANVIGKTSIDQATPGTTNAVQTIPGTTGGLSIYTVQPTASDNHVVIKAGAGQVYKISITNNQAVINYVRLYNATTGFNGCNSATNLVYANVIPGNSTGTGIMDEWTQGMAFSTGISICVTSGYATTDTTNATASAMNVNIGYK